MDSPTPPPRRWRRRFRRLLIVLLVLASVVLVLLAAFVGWHLYLRKVHGDELRAAIARTDELDPGWSLEEIEARRAVVPDEENGAPVVRAARKLLPEDWPPHDFDNYWDGLLPQQRLRDDQAAALREFLAELRPALEEARRIEGFPRGRHPITYAENPLETRLPHADDTGKVAVLLRADVLHRVQEGDTEGALRSSQALFNAGRCLGDEPFMITLLARFAFRKKAILCLERAIAQGTPSEAGLASLQRLLEDEEGQNLLPQVLRGDRAVFHQLFLKFESGRFALEDFDRLGRPPQGWQKVSNLWVIPRVMQSHAEILDLLNEAIEAAELPTEFHADFFEGFHDRARVMSPLARALLSAVSKTAPANVRAAAELRSAIAAVATERYRLAHGRWPNDLTDLVPKFLTTVPIDPYDGAPLRYAHPHGGVVLYSLGDDRKDDGGNLYRSEGAPGRGNDYGFRLWDVAKRRQPAPPAPPPDK